MIVVVLILQACGRQLPPLYRSLSEMVTLCSPPSLEFPMLPVIRPDAYRKRTACMATYKAGPLKASNILRVIRQRVA